MPPSPPVRPIYFHNRRRDGENEKKSNLRRRRRRRRVHGQERGARARVSRPAVRDLLRKSIGSSQCVRHTDEIAAPLAPPSPSAVRRDNATVHCGRCACHITRNGGVSCPSSLCQTSYGRRDDESCALTRPGERFFFFSDTCGFLFFTPTPPSPFNQSRIQIIRLA